MVADITTSIRTESVELEQIKRMFIALVGNAGAEMATSFKFDVFRLEWYEWLREFVAESSDGLVFMPRSALVQLRLFGIARNSYGWIMPKMTERLEDGVEADMPTPHIVARIEQYRREGVTFTGCGSSFDYQIITSDASMADIYDAYQLTPADDASFLLWSSTDADEVRRCVILKDVFPEAPAAVPLPVRKVYVSDAR